jgi:putative transposase
VNRKKAKVKVARAHSRIRDARRDFLHKASTDMVRRFDAIAVEDLAVANMVRNRKLARSISRTGWAEFRTLLRYKAHRDSRHIAVVSRWYPSTKTCSICGHLLATISLGTRHWTCPSCGARHDRDVNAAKNIAVAAGLVETKNACGAGVRHGGPPSVRPAMNQEISRVTGGVPRL